MAFDLEDLVGGAMAPHQGLSDAKSLSFLIEISPEARGRYLGDAARICRILKCVADNAVKFTPAGGVILEVDRQADQVIFRVTDTGIGISEPDQARLFEGFFQADATLSRPYGGAGVGLAVSRKLVTRLGGTIEAESKAV